VYALSREVSRARIEGRKSQHDSDRLNADIVAKRLVRYLDKAGYVVMKKSPLGGILTLPEGLVSAIKRTSKAGAGGFQQSASTHSPVEDPFVSTTIP
jgi:hypothetical protein